VGRQGKGSVEHAHDVSKAAEKSGGPPIRKNAVPAVSSGAGAILNLQRAAGNQAVAKMLKGPASALNAGAAGPESPATRAAAPITVQREWLDTAIEDALKGQGQDLYPKEFAQKLVAKINEPTPSSGGADSGQKKGTGVTGTTATGATIAAKTKIPTQKELDDKKKQLDEQEQILTGKGLTADQKKLLDESKELDLRQAKLREEQDLAERKKNLTEKLSPEEINLRNQKEGLSLLEEEKKEKDEREALGRKRDMMARGLNPKKKSLSELKGGRSL
jgi:hypothetical protein